MSKPSRNFRARVVYLTLALYTIASMFCLVPPVVANDIGLSGTYPLAVDYDLDSTTYTAVCYTGRMGRVLDDWIPGNARITTSSSTTTTTSLTSSTSAFQAVEQYDALLVMQNGLPLRRYVSAAASVDSITVNSAWDLSDLTAGYRYSYRNFTTGTAAESCWIPVAGYKSFTVQFIIDQMVVTGGIDFKLECRMEAAISSPSVIFSNNYTAADSDGYSVQNNEWDQCRVMVKIGTSDDGGDLTTNAEKVSAFFQGSIR
jgi:hypothetical protein